MKKLYRDVIITVFLVYFIITIASQQKTLNQYKAEAETYSMQLQNAEEEQEELKQTQANANSTEYIEEVAREKLGMYLPNERVYIDMGK